MSKLPPIPFVDLQAQYRRLKPSIDARIHKVLEHGKFILGPEVFELEQALARFADASEAVGVASGTEALRLPLMAAEIGTGDAVFLPDFTFTATAEVVVAIGATPVFVDVAMDTYNIDANALERAIANVRAEGALRPRAVIAVDLFGLAADYSRLNATCAREGLLMIADAAQSFGGALEGVRVGKLAPVTATSFFPSKPLGAYGDGGAILTDDPARAAVYRSLRMHGAGDGRYDIVRVGTNARLDSLQAAILLAKLEIFEDEIVARERVARSYDQRLPAGAIRPPRDSRAISAWAQYCVLVEGRERVIASLTRQGIPTAIHYPKPLSAQPAFARFAGPPGSRPVSARLCESIMALPMHPYLDDATIDRIADALDVAISGTA